MRQLQSPDRGCQLPRQPSLVVSPLGFIRAGPTRTDTVLETPLDMDQLLEVVWNLQDNLPYYY
jgi:hypothetical protein